MNNNPGLQQLLNQFAHAIGLSDLEMNDEGRSALRFAGQTTVELAAREEQLLLYADLGAVPFGSETMLYPALLQANLFWQSTDGATLAITDHSPARVVLALSWEWTSRTPVQLEQLMERFVAIAELWTEQVQQTTGAADFSETDREPVGRRAEGSSGWDVLRG